MKGNGLPHVVIVGGGFAGLKAARALRRSPVRVTLVDSRNFHLFQPLLYQVATASLSPADIASPIRHILHRQKNVDVWMGEVMDIDTERRVVTLRDGQLSYDYLVLATGATHAYFGHPEWVTYAPGLKTVEDATEIRRRFLLAFEAAEREADPEARRTMLTFVIVGGGATGVEMAGAMAEIARKVMPGDFRAIDTTMARIILVEGLDRILPTYEAASSESATRQLQRLGVEVRTGALVTEIGEDRIVIGDHQVIHAGNVFWAAGVAASALGAKLGVPVDRAGRVLVEPDLTIPGHREVFVAGDLASIAQDGSHVPGVAPAAMQMGRFAGRAIAAEVEGRERGVFRYFDKGSLATVGRAAAVAEFGSIRMAGFIAWLVWAGVHILYLIGFRNRLVVMIQWAWSWLLYQRGIRLITGDIAVPLHHARVKESAREEAVASRV
jgi:NADH dehydrogenase